MPRPPSITNWSEGREIRYFSIVSSLFFHVLVIILVSLYVLLYPSRLVFFFNFLSPLIWMGLLFCLLSQSSSILPAR